MSTKPKWWHHLTGGRPMTYLRMAVLDLPRGVKLHYWRDAFGRTYIAARRWSLIRTRVDE